MTAATVFRYLGLRKKRPTERDLIDRVREGLPIGNVRSFLAHHPFTLEELDRDLGIPRSTWSRLKRQGGRFNPAQSEKLKRLVEIFALAVEVFEDEERAIRWLREPNRALGGDHPLALLDTDTGSRWVETVLLRIEHGVYS